MKIRTLKSFTLIELLVVIAILGLLAGLTVPVLKNFGKSSGNLAASRQLLDGVARARQLAISQDTTVYMIFVPTNFWMVGGTFPNAWWNALTPAQQNTATNLAGRQLVGYTFVTLRSVGDQPGAHHVHYIDRWQTLPEGNFIQWNKFYGSNTIAGFNISRFNYTNNIPFPTADSPTSVLLPYIAFNYLGQMVGPAGQIVTDEFIPLAKGSVAPVTDINKKYLLTGSPQIAEVPPGNSTNIAYNIIHITGMTGRAVLEYQKVQ